jgi:hypothetical protein
MIPSKAIAAVASSALRNCGISVQQDDRSPWKTHLDKRVALFIIALHGKDWVPGCPSADLHLGHLVVEEIGEILLIDLRCDAAYVQAPRLTR